jgi:hypothetical protein
VGAGQGGAVVAQSSPGVRSAPSKAGRIPPTVVRRAGGVLLNIAARNQAPESPRAGWCGETAIQEALLFHGTFLPQRTINKAGKPSHPDLYASDIPRALKALRVDFTRYSWAVKGFGKFRTWLQAQLARGEPVLVGMKIHPTEHPSWGLDHFALAVGYDAQSMTVNTTWGRRAKRSIKQLTTKVRGLSFKNKYNRYFGLRIRGFTGRGKNERPVRLFVTSESTKQMSVRIKCEGLATGQRYRVQRFAAHPRRAKPVRTWTFTAPAKAHVITDTIDKKRPARYRCAPVTR